MADLTVEPQVSVSERSAADLDLPQGIPPLAELYLYIAGSCNLACRHCWIVPKFMPGGENGQFLDLAYVRKAIQQAKPLGLGRVKLTGGEPMLHPQFREMVTMIHQQGLSITIETNGTLIDNEIARFMQQMFRSASVSLDGATAATHEYMRNVSGSFERTLQGIRSLVEAGLRPQIICTLHKGNVGELEQLLTLAEKLGVSSLKLNIVQQVGRGERFSASEGLDVPEILELGRYIEGELIPRSTIPLYLDVPKAFFSIRRLFADRGRCSILNILGVLASGELSMCGIGVTTPELVYGHLETDDLHHVWCNSPQLELLRERIPFQLDGICAECIHQADCLGHCVANSFYSSHRIDSSYYFCERAAEMGLFPESRRRPASR
jgi:SynChlorMet cassette radical SAM/SPASM protein ScmF